MNQLENRRRRVIAGLQVGITLVLLGVWEYLIRTGAGDAFFFGQPSQIIEYLFKSTSDGYLIKQTWVTLYEEILGFGIGTAAGTALGLALWWSPYLSRVLEPFAIALNATPKIVVAPILIFWFGIGLTSKVMIAVLICAIVAWLGAFEGWRKADGDQMDMVRAIGGRSWDVFTKIVVPSSLSWIITSARINIGLALIGVITGEFLASTQGLGYLVLYTAEQYRMSETLAVIVLIALLAMVQLHVVNWMERKLFAWAYEPEHGMEFIS